MSEPGMGGAPPVEGDGAGDAATKDANDGARERRLAGEEMTEMEPAAGLWTPKLQTLLATVAVVVPLDQVTKYQIVSQLPEGDRLPVIEGFFYLTHARNSGAVFGLLRDLPSEWRIVLFGTLALAAAWVIGSFLRSLAPGDRRSAFALGCILGGALGNFTDRLLPERGAVIDFLHFRLWTDFAWPDFNVADICIVMGVAALILELLAAEGAARASAAEPEP